MRGEQAGGWKRAESAAQMGPCILSPFVEFFADNLGDFFIFLRRFADDILETSADSLEHILHFVTVFMGDVDR